MAADAVTIRYKMLQLGKAIYLIFDYIFPLLGLIYSSNPWLDD